ncbi:MAG: hypothetical protein WC796_04890 [Candidatus Pacearchaeota archaeon]|jgi:hypothetical protein
MKKSLLILGLIFGVVLSLTLINAASNITITNPNCHNFYWVDNTNTTCGYKEFCGSFSYPGLRVYVTEHECVSSSEENCHFYYYIDDNHKNCDKKKFCNLYMYQGLQTFDTKQECLSQVNSTDGIVGGDKDAHGCIGSAGYQWCEEKQKCLRVWEENCSNNNSRIKIMPETASARAIERLGQLNFTIILKEKISQGDQGILQPYYELTAEKQGKMLGLFKVKGNVLVQVDAENGEIVSVKKPWWTFLASGI